MSFSEIYSRCPNTPFDKIKIYGAVIHKNAEGIEDKKVCVARHHWDIVSPPINLYILHDGETPIVKKYELTKFTHTIHEGLGSGIIVKFNEEKKVVEIQEMSQ